MKVALLSLLAAVAVAQPTVSDFDIPARVRTIVYYADLTNDDASAQQQLQSKTKSVSYAWDLDANSYSELWRPNGTSISTFFTHKGTSVMTYSKSKGCSKTTDLKTNWLTSLNARFRTRFPVKLNATTDFGDPFQPDIYPTEKYSVWRSADERLWLWVRQANNQIAYIQEYRTDTKSVLVYWFPTGLLSESSNLVYEFYNFKCPTKY